MGVALATNQDYQARVTRIRNYSAHFLLHGPVHHAVTRDQFLKYLKEWKVDDVLSKQLLQLFES
jgi:hypothetical protein